MVGDKRKYNVALVSVKCTLNLETGEPTDQLAGEALEVNPGLKTVSEAIVDDTWKQVCAGVPAIRTGGAGVLRVRSIKAPISFTYVPNEVCFEGIPVQAAQGPHPPQPARAQGSTIWPRPSGHLFPLQSGPPETQHCCLLMGDYKTFRDPGGNTAPRVTGPRHPLSLLGG